MFQVRYLYGTDQLLMLQQYFAIFFTNLLNHFTVNNPPPLLPFHPLRDHLNETTEYWNWWQNIATHTLCVCVFVYVYVCIIVFVCVNVPYYHLVYCQYILIAISCQLRIYDTMLL